MEYQVTFVIDGKRNTLVLEHIKEEYGVSEQDFWSCWILGEKYIVGDGDTAELAIQKLISDKKMINKMRRQFRESIVNPGFQTPIIDVETIKYDNIRLAIQYGLVNIGR